MAGLTRRAVVLGKIQSGVGVPAVPVAPLNGLLVSDMSFAVDGQMIERNFLRDSLSALPARLGRKLFTANFTFELKGGPVAGARPEWSPLVRAGGMSETFTGLVETSIRDAGHKWTVSGTGGAGCFYVDLFAGGDPAILSPVVVREAGEDLKKAATLAGIQPGQYWYGDGDTLGFSTVYVKTSTPADPDTLALDSIKIVTAATNIAYEFRDTSFEYGTFYIYPDGLLLQCQDAIIDITGVQMNAGAPIMCTAQLRSKYVTPTDVVLPTSVIYQTHLPPLAESMAFTLESYALGTIPSFSINFGNTIGERLDLNSPYGFKSMSITGRNPTGQLSIEQELIATFPFFTRWEQGTTMPWSATMGSAGQRITFSGPALQATTIASSDIGGRRGLNIGLKLTAPGVVKEFKMVLD